MVSLFAFALTASGMNPYLVASFNSNLACETAKSALVAAALEQSAAGTSTYSLAPRTLRCIATPGLVVPGAPPVAGSLSPRTGTAAARRPAKK